MIERRVIICKKCLKPKDAFQDGKFDGVNKRWRDSEGRLWNGRTCPVCHASKVAEGMNKLRKGRQNGIV